MWLFCCCCFEKDNLIPHPSQLRSSDDPLPLQLCVDCQTTFEKWKEFRTKAQDSHRQFRNEFYLDRALADCLWMDLDKAEQMKKPENQPLSQDVREKTRPVLDGLDCDEENPITLFLEDSDSETFTRDSDSSAADDEDVDGNYQPPDDNQDSSDDDDQKVLSQRTRSSEGSLKRKREEENNRYLCDQCTRTFTRIGHLEIHQRTHFTEEDIEERFCCNRCEKNFATQSNLNKHKRTHSKKNRDSFSCKHCEKSFAQQDYLIIHERIHTGVKPFKCDHKNCGKAFSRITYLNGHKRTHSGERPFKCDKCDQTFTQKTHLTTHEKVHKPRATRMNIRRSNKVIRKLSWFVLDRGQVPIFYCFWHSEFLIQSLVLIILLDGNYNANSYFICCFVK